jgi:hypothetical protein
MNARLRVTKGDLMPIPKAELMRRLRARRRAERLAERTARPAQPCEACGEPLPPAARANRRTCSEACRARLGRIERQMTQLDADEIRRLCAALDAWMAGIPVDGTRVFDARSRLNVRDEEVHASARFRVTKFAGQGEIGLGIEAKRGLRELRLAIWPDGRARRLRRAARLERLLFEAGLALPAEPVDDRPLAEAELDPIRRTVVRMAEAARMVMVTGPVRVEMPDAGLLEVRPGLRYRARVSLHGGLVLQVYGRLGQAAPPEVKLERHASPAHARTIGKVLETADVPLPPAAARRAAATDRAIAAID